MNGKQMRQFFCSFVLLVVLFCLTANAAEPLRVLIYSGANNHNWQETTGAIKDILPAESMSVDVTNNPESITSKLLCEYDVIVSNWNNFKDKKLVWSDSSKMAFLGFISKGGGHVMLHAGGSSYNDWPEYHKIVASWGKGTSHGSKHEFPVTIDLPSHRICEGLAEFKTNDELWRNTKFPEGSIVLMSGFSSKNSGGNDTNEPILTVSNYGKGRCVNFMLGHDVATMANPNFKSILTRSVLWAASRQEHGSQFSSFKWQRNDKSVALINNGKAVWQFNYGKETPKPFFHPVSLVDGTVLTVDRPSDHLWHHGLWFSWKFLNGINYWEENRKTGKSDGMTCWSNVKIVTNDDNSANISMDLEYHHKDHKPILSEKRIMKVSQPDPKGIYYIDWTSSFTACSDTEVIIDRTPIPGQENGKSWGGYAGLSARLNGKGEKWEVVTEKEPITFEKGTFRGKAESMDFSGVFDGRAAGIAILSNPKNINAPTPWYAIDGKVMKYFSPAVICYKPLTLKPGQSFTLNYRIIVHHDRWNAETLETEIKKYKHYVTIVKDKKDD